MFGSAGEVTIPPKKEDEIHAALSQHEVPPKYRAAAEALARKLGFTIETPLPPKEDPQLEAGLEELRKRMGQ